MKVLKIGLLGAAMLWCAGEAATLVAQDAPPEERSAERAGRGRQDSNDDGRRGDAGQHRQRADDAPGKRRGPPREGAQESHANGRRRGHAGPPHAGPPHAGPPHAGPPGGDRRHRDRGVSENRFGQGGRGRHPGPVRGFASRGFDRVVPPGFHIRFGAHRGRLPFARSMAMQGPPGLHRGLGRPPGGPFAADRGGRPFAAGEAGAQGRPLRSHFRDMFQRRLMGGSLLPNAGPMRRQAQIDQGGGSGPDGRPNMPGMPGPGWPPGPRPGATAGAGTPGGHGPGPAMNSGPDALAALDTNHDGRLSSEEIDQAIVILRRMDRNHDGSLTPDELRPQVADGRRDDRSPPDRGESRGPDHPGAPGPQRSGPGGSGPSERLREMFGRPPAEMGGPGRSMSGPPWLQRRAGGPSDRGEGSDQGPRPELRRSRPAAEMSPQRPHGAEPGWRPDDFGRGSNDQRPDPARRNFERRSADPTSVDSPEPADAATDGRTGDDRTGTADIVVTALTLI